MTTRKIIFLVFFLVLQLGLIWPIFSFFSGTYPMILGLPLSFAWVIGILICSFLLVLWYYLTDPEIEPSQIHNNQHG